MKKMILLLVLLLLLTGCQEPVKPTENSGQDQVDIEEIEENDESGQSTENKGPVIRDEKAVLEALDALAEENVDPAEINAFLMDHISNLGIESANYALVTYLDQILEYGGKADGEILSPAYQLLAEEAFKDVFDMEMLEGVKDQGFVDTIENIYANGMKIEYTNGYYVTVIDYERLLKGFGNEIGEDIKAYIQLVQMTLRERVRANDRDGMNQVAMLIVEYDKYLKTYPNSMVIDEVRSTRDWLREVYFLESTSVQAHAYRDGESFAMESFRDVIQFYPGAELEKMTQDFLDVWASTSYEKSSVLKPFVEFYDEGLATTELVLGSFETPEGLMYPELNGIEAGGVIESYMEKILKDQLDRYKAEDMNGWTFIQDYDIVYLDQDYISVVFSMNLAYPSFPNLSIRDIEGHTFSLQDGRVMTLEELLPTEQESFTHLFADMMIYAARSKFDMSGVDENWLSSYMTKDGIVIYKGGVYTGHNAKMILMPYETIAEWIN